MLVVTPSKSDRERVIPMSAEVFHVIAQVIRRHIGAHGTVPVCTRYDLHEKIWSEPLPYLFQTVHGGAIRAMSTTAMWRMIHRAADGLIATDPRFAEVKFAPTISAGSSRPSWSTTDFRSTSARPCLAT
ncbi:hypothetical protein ACH4VR_25385 [Streptomyces sp. NPDC020883]|uniref:hypothetical protein n=1 Tax=Streptomyces sp. NPDC020883 TaxID=3365099 RepID=UPI00379CF0C8